MIFRLHITVMKKRPRGGYGVATPLYENVKKREGGEKDEWEILYFMIYVFRCKGYNMF